MYKNNFTNLNKEHKIMVKRKERTILIVFSISCLFRRICKYSIEILFKEGHRIKESFNFKPNPMHKVSQEFFQEMLEKCSAKCQTSPQDCGQNESNAILDVLEHCPMLLVGNSITVTAHQESCLNTSLDFNQESMTFSRQGNVHRTKRKQCEIVLIYRKKETVKNESYLFEKLPNSCFKEVKCKERNVLRSSISCKSF